MNRGNIEIMKVDVTEELLNVLNDMGIIHHKMDLHGRHYVKVYCTNGKFRDLSRFKYGWLSAHPNILLDICNICSGPYLDSFYVSVIQNWDELDDCAKRYIYEMNG